MDETFANLPFPGSVLFESKGPFLQGTDGSLVLLMLLFLAAISHHLINRRSQLRHRGDYFKHYDGRPLQKLNKNSRFRRFTHGKELSEEGYQRFGQDPYLIKNGSLLELVISSPQQVREFFSTDATNHRKPPDCNMGAYFHRTLGKCVGVLNGNEWKVSRRNLDPHFAFSTAASMIVEFREMIKKWATSLQDDSMVALKTPGGFDFDALTACRQLPFRLIAMGLYGEMLSDSLFDELWDLNTLHEKTTFHSFLGKWQANTLYQFLPTEANRDLSTYERRWRELNLRTAADADKNGQCCPVEKMYHPVKDGKITLQSYLQSIDEILYTNIDVTSSMFAYALINLARNTEIQESLRAEILVIGAIPAQMADYAQRDDTLLHKTYLEILRHNPPAWFSLPETTAVDKRIDGYLIPAGTSVVIDLQRLNKRSPIWSPDGDEFRPQRWDIISSFDARYSLHGYGIGPRKCLGKNFANIGIKLLLITILEEYTLSPGSAEMTVKRDRFTCTPEDVISFKRREL